MREYQLDLSEIRDGHHNVRPNGAITALPLIISSERLSPSRPLPVPEPTHDLLVPLLARADEVVVVDAEEGGRGAVLGRDTVAKLPACN